MEFPSYQNQLNFYLHWLGISERRREKMMENAPKEPMSVFNLFHFDFGSGQPEESR